MSAFKTLGALTAVSFFPLTQAWYRPLPPCLSDYQPFVQAGCFDNGRDGAKPALTERMDMDIYNMTTEKCVDTCKGNGFRYAGLAYFGACHCGQTVDKPMVENSKCHMACSGNRSETCGGEGTINIYQDPTFLPVGETTVDEYVALGCHKDNVNGGKAVFYRQDQLDDRTMTTKACLNSCLAGGFPFAGTEYGGECYCGVVLGNGTAKVDDASCEMPCTGAPDEICGGPSLINIYVAKDLQSLEPCGHEPPHSSSVPVTSKTSSTSSTWAVTSTSSGTARITTTTMSKSSTITSHLPATSSTTGAELCTSTVVTPGGCDYSCGKWCYNMPGFHDAKSCKKASAHCKLQKWSCFKKAGMPHALDCHGYETWCEEVDRYCDSCRGRGGCSKAACITMLPVPTPLPTETVVAPCEPTTTTSKVAPPPTTTAASEVPAPTGPGLCKQPGNKLCGYRPGYPLGGIDLPMLTCNNLAADFGAGNALKLYMEQDSDQCPSYPRHEAPAACARACAAQFDECLAVYVPGVRAQGRFGAKTYGLGLGLGLDLSLDWVQAKACCSLQLLDCKAANLRPVVDGCRKFGDLS